MTLSKTGSEDRRVVIIRGHLAVLQDSYNRVKGLLVESIMEEDMPEVGSADYWLMVEAFVALKWGLS